MNRSFFSVIILLISLAACKHDPGSAQQAKTSASAESDAIRDSVFRYVGRVFDQARVVDTTYDTDRLLTDVRKLGDSYPNDTTVAEAVYKSGAIMAARGSFTKAIGAWGVVKDEFPQSKFAPMALFQQAITLDNDLNDDNLARQYYQEFLKTYPHHSLAADVMKLMPLLGKTDAELVKEFEKKNK